MVSVSASVNLPFHHKVQKFSSGTGSPGWSRKKGRKTVVMCDCSSIIDISNNLRHRLLCLLKGLMKFELYAMIIYISYYVISMFELLLFSFADSSVLPDVDDPQVCVMFTCNLYLSN